MCTLPLLAGENIGSRCVVPTVAGCIDIVVHLVTEPDRSRRVREIVAVAGRVEGDVVELEPIFAVRRLLEYCESPRSWVLAASNPPSADRTCRRHQGRHGR